MKSILFYFTGSGNSLAIAKDLSRELGDTEIVRITKENEAGVDVEEYDRVGIIFPIYFSGIPYMVGRFLEALKLNQDAYIYAVAHYGSKVDVGLKQISDLLLKKGKILNGAFEFSMPGNYQITFDLDSEEKIKKNFDREKEMVKVIAEKVRQRTDSPLIPVSAGNRFKSKLIYSIFKPEKMDKNFWSDKKCNGCGICKKICPAGNITMEKNRPQWNRKCEQCLSCLHFCPKEAVQYRRGTVKRGRYRHPEVSLKELVVHGKE